MAVSVQNRARVNKATNYVLPEHIHDNAEVIATQLPIRTSTLLLIPNNRQQSPQLGESSRQLARQKIDRSSWSSSISRNISLPLISHALNYILKRAASIPSRLYRKMDLPLFRRKRKPKIFSTQSGEAFSDRQQSTSILQTDELLTEMPPHYSGDKAEEEQSLHISDEAYPDIIGNLYSSPAAIYRMVDIRHEFLAMNSNTPLSPMVASFNVVNQTNTEDDSLTFHDNHSSFLVKDIFQTTWIRQSVDNQARADLNQSNMAGKYSRYVHTDQISPRTLSPFRQRIYLQKEISKKHRTGVPIQESSDISDQDSIVPHIINVQEKPIVTPVRQMKLISFTGKLYGISSEEVPAHHDGSSYQVIGSGQAAMSKDQTSFDTTFKQKLTTINRVDSRKSRQSLIPGLAKNLNKQPLKSSLLKKVGLSGEIS